MILKSLKLNNIRSYIDETINFPAGSVLLSGDIGSGKSTILLAIEFALFGVKRKHLSGAALLRHGVKEGSVELSFSIDNCEYTVKRVLKRGKDTIKQDAGYIISNGIKKEGTAVELKSVIIDLIGYPKDLITKTSDLVYRYTVFTPQEEMKQILIEDAEIRLNTLRRVFGIDKYKKIKENCASNIKEIKDKVKVNYAKIELLDDKKKINVGIKEQIDKIKLKIDSLFPSTEEIKKEIGIKRKELVDVEENIKKVNELKKEFSVLENNYKFLNEQLDRNNNDLKQLNEQILIAEKEVKDTGEIDSEKISKNIQDKINESNLMDRTLSEVRNKISEFNAKITHSKDIKEKISNINHCPICDQDVGDVHKHTIHKREDDKIKQLDSDMKIYSEKSGKAEIMLKNLNAELDNLRKEENELKIKKIRQDNLNDKLKLKSNLEEAQGRLKVKIMENENKLNSLKRDIANTASVDNIHNILKKEYDVLLSKERELSIQIAEFGKEKESMNKQLESLDTEIKYMEDIKNKSLRLKQLVTWMEEYFLNVMSVIERQVMFQVYSQFNEVFQNWFNILIEDESINVKLDDTFSPIIDQNGYESDIENLSGGEKTSCALAYRLALNKVVNNLIGTIKTKDLLILDEPTDGFSTEQLDKVRDVLEQLSLKQIIIVSHESKVESFVDNVVRIHKEEQISHVIA